MPEPDVGAFYGVSGFKPGENADTLYQRPQSVFDKMPAPAKAGVDTGFVARHAQKQKVRICSATLSSPDRFWHGHDQTLRGKVCSAEHQTDGAGELVLLLSLRHSRQRSPPAPGPCIPQNRRPAVNPLTFSTMLSAEIPK